MFPPVRVAFDVSLPVVAAQAFTAGEKTLAQGDAVDWRALGISEMLLYAWWRSGLVAFQPMFHVGPGQHVTVRATKRKAD